MIEPLKHAGPPGAPSRDLLSGSTLTPADFGHLELMHEVMEVVT